MAPKPPKNKPTQSDNKYEGDGSSDDKGFPITEGLSLIILTGLFYLGAYSYEAGYCDYFGIPTTQIRVDLATLLLFASMIFEGRWWRFLLFMGGISLVCVILMWWVGKLRKAVWAGKCLKVGILVLTMLGLTWGGTKFVRRFGFGKAEECYQWLYRETPRKEVVLRVYEGVAITAGVNTTNVDCVFRFVDLKESDTNFTLTRIGKLNPQMKKDLQ